jgi:ABC-type dipeptide/oligopeptide/nickel transport system permease component
MAWRPKGYILTRALSLGLSLVVASVVASVVIFALIEVIPGDPAASCWA